MLGVVQDGEPVGQIEFEEEVVRHELKRVVKVESKSTLAGFEHMGFYGSHTDSRRSHLYSSACRKSGRDMFRFHQAHGVDEHGRSFGQRGGNPGLPALGVMALAVCLSDLKFLRPLTQKHLRLPFRPLLSVVILILMMVVPVKASESDDQSENDMFPPEAESLQSRRKSWRNGFG